MSLNLVPVKHADPSGELYFRWIEMAWNDQDFSPKIVFERSNKRFPERRIEYVANISLNNVRTKKGISFQVMNTIVAMNRSASGHKSRTS